ncbi:MAG: hypothetical protein ACRDWH_00710 [Acidimicrobiia bacterium]
MTADFTGKPLPLPPGAIGGPEPVMKVTEPAWLSPGASHRIVGRGDSRGHLLVGGQTVWVEREDRPAAILVSHPNRLGSAEDLTGLVGMANRLGAVAMVDVDPLLTGSVDLPEGVVPLWQWPGGHGAIAPAGSRARQAAFALRRRLSQIRGIVFPVEHPVGRTVTAVLPVPAGRVVEGLAGLGALVEMVDLWEGGLAITPGWWHTRMQIDALVRAIGAIVTGAKSEPIPADRFERVPDDLPLRFS